VGEIGKLGNDGKLYVALPDGVEKEATIKAEDENFYTFTVDKSKFTPKIFANGYNLDEETPEFCVGEKVTFVLTNLYGYVDAVSHWKLPEKFVNEPYSYSSTCTSYRKNDSLLLNTFSTSCWFVNGQGGDVSIGTSLHFSNDQYVTLAATGKFRIYRPKPIDFLPNPPFYAALVPSGSPDELRLGDDAENGRMAYTLKVASDYSGLVNIVQLINASRANSGWTGGGSLSTTDGELWLDNEYL
jgi:hypothetical protein